MYTSKYTYIYYNAKSDKLYANNTLILDVRKQARLMVDGSIDSSLWISFDELKKSEEWTLIGVL